MSFRFVYRTADISALSRSSLYSVDISAFRYTNMNGIVFVCANLGGEQKKTEKIEEKNLENKWKRADRKKSSTRNLFHSYHKCIQGFGEHRLEKNCDRENIKEEKREKKGEVGKDLRKRDREPRKSKTKKRGKEM